MIVLHDCSFSTLQVRELSSIQISDELLFMACIDCNYYFLFIQSIQFKLPFRIRDNQKLTSLQIHSMLSSGNSCKIIGQCINNLQSRFISEMHFSFPVYAWLVANAIIPNTGEQDEKGVVDLPPNLIINFDNGFLVGEIIRKITVSADKKLPSAFAVKSDATRNTRLTNWNFIWLALDAIDLKMDVRIKELILQGEQTLIVEIINKLYEKDGNKNYQDKISIKIKTTLLAKKPAQPVDLRKINMAKDPEQSEASLEFLVLLLRASLGMKLQEILGLFTNQNKYLAQIIVKGVNQNFDPIILFFSLLNKHSKKLRALYQRDSLDAEACLLALKSGFISKNQQVSLLAIQLFGNLGNIYQWFVGEQSKCSTMLLRGLKRHFNLRSNYWNLLLKIIKGEEIDFFTKNFPNSFQNDVQQLEICTYLIKLISESVLREKLCSLGIISIWLEMAIKLPENDVDTQIICFRFVGELMLYLPSIIDQNDNSLFIFQRKWYMKTLSSFAMLFNELIVILEKLGEERSNIARKVYMMISLIAKNVGLGDKRDYLVENFLPLISKFPAIPSEHIIQHLKRTPLSNSEFLLVCEVIQCNQNVATSIAIGKILKQLFLENPLINFYLGPLIKEIMQKVINDFEFGLPFFEKVVEEALNLLGSLEVKYKFKLKQNSPYLGKKGPLDKIAKQQDDELVIKDKEKQILLGFIISIVELVKSLQDNEDLLQILKKKMLSINAHIRINNHKIGCKGLEEILSRKLAVNKEQQVAHFQQFSKHISYQMEESMNRKSKVNTQVALSRVKGPENITKQFQQIVEKRKQQEEERKMHEVKQKELEEKKRLSVKKQLQKANLLRGQIGQAQLREFGFLQRLMQEPKQLEVIPLPQMQEREINAIEDILKRYNRVLRNLFLSYTWTTYNNHSNQKFEDNRQRKQILNVVELVKLLKDYRLIFLTSQQEVSNIVRDINIKLLDKRQMNELDYHGFEQFIIQFCALIMTRNHTITTTAPGGKSIAANNFKDQPIHIILNEFFAYLKNVFIARGEKVNIFEEVTELPLSKEQQIQVQNFTKKLQKKPNYILPKQYKKVPFSIVKSEHKITSKIGGMPQSYLVSVEILDEIFNKQFNAHIIESIMEKKAGFKVKPTAIGNPLEPPKGRAMSTYIQRKIPLPFDKDSHKRSSSKGINTTLAILPPEDRKIGQEAATALEDIISKLEVNKEKPKLRQKKIVSSKKIQELEKSKLEYLHHKIQEKQQAKKLLQQKQKEAELKRREKTQKFLTEQKIKIALKREREQEQKLLQMKELEHKQEQKKQLKQKFKMFHLGQVQKIKKIECDTIQKIRQERDQSQYQKLQRIQLKKKLRGKIEEEDKRIGELRKQSEQNIRMLLESESIKSVFSKYESNIKAVFHFLLQNTFQSLTEKKHNSQIIFDAWKYFISVFELAIIVASKDTSIIFKNLTKHKLASKEYFVGLTFVDFQEALLRIAIKYKTVFNLISTRIKDFNHQISESLVVSQVPEGETKKGEGKLNQSLAQKQQNEFDSINDEGIKQLLKSKAQIKDAAEQYSDISEVTDKTLLGLIYYLKVPNSKQGQEKRFREILASEHPSFAPPAQKLKEKLTEQYTLNFQQNKESPNRNFKQRPSVSQRKIV